VTSQWQYQVRFDLNDSATAESVRRKLRVPALAPLFDILAEHRAALKCQFDAFAEYVAAQQKSTASKIIRSTSGRRRRSKIRRRRKSI
jgi:hypothetical protein